MQVMNKINILCSHAYARSVLVASEFESPRNVSTRRNIRAMISFTKETKKTVDSYSNVVCLTFSSGREKNNIITLK